MTVNVKLVAIKIAIASILMALLYSCSTPSRTKYQQWGETGGYLNKTLGKNLYSAMFGGNALTVQEDALMLAKFRAVEICDNDENKFAVFHNVINRTITDTVIKSNTDVTPYNFLGTTSYSGNTTSWVENREFPTYEVIFSCEHELLKAGIDFEVVDRTVTSPTVKDNLGGLLVRGFATYSLNGEVLRRGDIVVSVEGNRVISVKEFSESISRATKPNKISVSFIREQKIKNGIIKLSDVSFDFRNENSKLIANACRAEEISNFEICGRNSEEK